MLRDLNLIADRIDAIADRLSNAEHDARKRANKHVADGVPLGVDVFIAGWVQGEVAQAVNDLRFQAKSMRPRKRRVAR